MVPRVPWEVMTLPLSSMAVCLISQAYGVLCLCLYVYVYVVAPPQVLDPVKKHKLPSHVCSVRKKFQFFFC